MASLLGLDIGDVRIGVALADATAPFPAPLTTLEASETLAREFATLLQKYHVQIVVIGYPRNQSGEPTQQTERVQYIASLLAIPPSVQIVWQDESLTSVKAEEELTRRKKPFTKGDVDALAATYILNDYVSTGAYKNPASSQVVSRSEPVVSSKKHRTKKTAKHPEQVGHSKAATKANSKPKTKKKSKVFFGIASVGMLFAAIFIAAVAWYTSALSPRTADDVYHVVTVKPGTSSKQIATVLQDTAVIKSAKAFTLYIRLNGINNLQAGSYRLSSGDSTQQIIKTISGGKVSSTSVLISPGLRLDQILAVLEKEGYTKEQLTTALSAVRDHPILSDYPKTARLEGYLYPDTYQIDPNTSAESLLRTILTNFDSAITPDIRQGLARQGLSLRQGIILASIVQMEVSDTKIQPTVAQVFIKRMNEGVVLGSDVTYKYAAAQSDFPDDPSSNSPYNTRKYAGLPPTAIANFNINALRAVANPSSTTYNYFVAGDDGKTYFSSTIEQHQAYIDKYCIKGCQ